MKLTTSEEFDELSELLKESLDNIGIPVTYNEDKIREICDYFKYATSDSVFHEAVKVDGALVGFVLAGLQDSLLEDAVIAQEIGAYVKPDHRGQGHFGYLMNAYESWAKEKNAVEIRSMVPDSLLGVASKRGYNKTLNLVVKRM